MERLSPSQDPDLSVLKRLQHQAQQLQAVAQRHPDLEQLRFDLLQSSEQLGEELATYQQIKQEWEWFFEHSLDMFAIAGFDGYFKRVNAAFERTLGYGRDQMLAAPFVEFVHPEDVERTQQALQELGSGKDYIRFENRYRHKDGRWRWLEWTCPAAGQNDQFVYAIARDVTESKLSAQELLYRAEHDPLTGLGNRALFDEALAKAIARTERNPGNQVALLMLDLNGFKQINDNYGHGVGDVLLRIIASRLATCHRQGDVSCRLGGDEFALIVEGSTAIEIDRFATRLNELLGQPIEIGNLKLSVGCSTGVAVFPDHATDASGLLKLADEAMYAVKRRGGGIQRCDKIRPG